MAKGLRGMYRPLNVYLEHLPADQTAVRLTFAELEALLQGPLPLSARARTYFWSTSVVALRNWRRSGFRGRLDRQGGAVDFTRGPWP